MPVRSGFASRTTTTSTSIRASLALATTLMSALPIGVTAYALSELSASNERILHRMGALQARLAAAEQVRAVDLSPRGAVHTALPRAGAPAGNGPA